MTPGDLKARQDRGSRNDGPMMRFYARIEPQAAKQFSVGCELPPARQAQQEREKTMRLVRYIS